MKTAAVNEVDFILLCGDLFHEVKPSTDTVVRFVEIDHTVAAD